MPETKTLKVVGQQTMHCAGCEQTVKFTLEKLPGIETVVASHQTQQITLTVEADVVDLVQVQQELAWIGYQVSEVTET